MAAVFRQSDKDERVDVLDRAAICVSGLCLLQCLLLPLLVVVTPLMSIGFLGEEWFHLLLLVLILPISLLAFGLGYRIHGNRRMLVPGLAGLGIVMLAAWLEHEGLGALATALLTSLGGVLLITGHWLNLRDRRRLCLQPGS